VMYAGRVVETGTAREVLESPRHPDTQGLLASTYRGMMRGERLLAISGSPPDLSALPAGRSFAPRCGQAGPVCRITVPEETTLAFRRSVSCHLPEARKAPNREGLRSCVG
jgi:oligopeptide/dipeptide ABC transporter ATP-binding protein